MTKMSCRKSSTKGLEGLAQAIAFMQSRGKPPGGPGPRGFDTAGELAAGSLWSSGGYAEVGAIDVYGGDTVEVRVVSIVPEEASFIVTVLVDAEPMAQLGYPGTAYWTGTVSSPHPPGGPNSSTLIVTVQALTDFQDLHLEVLVF